jgi:hypothetical protein
MARRLFGSGSSTGRRRKGLQPSGPLDDENPDEIVARNSIPATALN